MLGIEDQKARPLTEVMRDEMAFRDKIVEILREEPKTIPEIAGALRCPTHEVMYWVMAMWRYGIVVETGKPDDNGYYQYQLKQ
jgi:predicted Rossmann fold nucleotide-binding protein DprA/Smf involved in DNA uptake